MPVSMRVRASVQPGARERHDFGKAMEQNQGGLEIRFPNLLQGQ